MSELERYNACMDQLHAPEAMYEEVWGMTKEQEKRPIMGRRTILVLAAVLVLLIALGAGAYAAGRSLYGWGGNFEVRSRDSGGEILTESILHTDSLKEPVVFENDRMIFIVNDEHIDITDSVSEETPFVYDYTDEEEVIHYWLVGKNGPELRRYGYAEYLRRTDGEWLGGYSARTNLDPENLPGWLTSGQEQLDLPWIKN